MNAIARDAVIPLGWGFPPGTRLLPVLDHGHERAALRRCEQARRTRHAVVMERAEIVLAEKLLDAHNWRAISSRFDGMSRASTYHLMQRAREVAERRARARRLGSARLTVGEIDV
ncbi:MAG: hypothetical protein HYV17_07860 [Xanthomonadales bacterium]|nr:hypothetical protein [Xanthomonadales bacterium]